MLSLVALLALAAAPLPDAAEALAEAAVEPAAEAAVGPAAVAAPQDAAEVPAEELRLLALGGATAIGVGLVGVLAAGIWFAAVDGRQATAPAGQREVAFAGVFVSTGLIAVGGVMVLADVLLGE
jgi:hypothetical protein